MVQTKVDAREASENIKLKSRTQSGSRGQAQGSSNPTASALLSQSHHIRCVYCNAPHYSASCDKVCDMKERKDILIKARHCFNCLRTNHKTRECLSTRMCRLCQQKHHQSICSSLSKKIEPFVPTLFHLSLQTQVTVPKHLAIPSVTRTLRLSYCRLLEQLLTILKLISPSKSEYFLIVEASGHILLISYVPDSNLNLFMLKNCK